MRLTSVMWLAVFMKMESDRGAYVTAARTGAQQAGSIFVIHNHLDGTASVYAPAPQAIASTEGGRSFEKVHERIPQPDAEEYLQKQVNFDPDLWIIETESGSGDPVLDFN